MRGASARSTTRPRPRRSRKFAEHYAETALVSIAGIQVHPADIRVNP